MKTRTLTKLEILNETISFYSEDTNRRAIDINGTCMYNTIDNKHCAVGRCLTEDIQSKGIDFIYNTSGVYKLNEEFILDNILQPQYKGHESSFWSKLQNLHDEPKHWNENGLTSSGKIFVERIKKEFNITE